MKLNTPEDVEKFKQFLRDRVKHCLPASWRKKTKGYYLWQKSLLPHVGYFDSLTSSGQLQEAYYTCLHQESDDVKASELFEKVCLHMSKLVDFKESPFFQFKISYLDWRVEPRKPHRTPHFVKKNPPGRVIPTLSETQAKLSEQDKSEPFDLDAYKKSPEYREQMRLIQAKRFKSV